MKFAEHYSLTRVCSGEFQDPGLTGLREPARMLLERPWTGAANRPGRNLAAPGLSWFGAVCPAVSFAPQNAMIGFFERYASEGGFLAQEGYMCYFCLGCRAGCMRVVPVPSTRRHVSNRISGVTIHEDHRSQHAVGTRSHRPTRGARPDRLPGPCSSRASMIAGTSRPSLPIPGRTRTAGPMMVSGVGSPSASRSANASILSCG